ncbi:hypothetical protein E2C01_039454 [Portunus trituberculatus]|uniref:Uncharacterized protein n=1 Tax=Portunus trituberculatus TaxID=210409 RepID=A0A5B7FLE5_PORTR|nr:hypothetical protein [Portunus trituberculatus]
MPENYGDEKKKKVAVEVKELRLPPPDAIAITKLAHKESATGHLKSARWWAVVLVVVVVEAAAARAGEELTLSGSRLDTQAYPILRCGLVVHSGEGGGGERADEEEEEE